MDFDPPSSVASVAGITEMHNHNFWHPAQNMEDMFPPSSSALWSPGLILGQDYELTRL
jgi:hypothetical protein